MISLLALLLVATQPPVSTIGTVEFQGNAFSKTIIVSISEAARDGTPVWKVKDGSPPLSARRAINLARRVNQWVDRQLEYDRGQYSWRLEPMSLRPMGDQKWYWLARFEVMGQDLAGSPMEMYAIILMNGRAVRPVLRDAGW